METIFKKVIVPIDASEDSLKALNYLHLLFGSRHHLEIVLLNIIPPIEPASYQDPNPSDDPGTEWKIADKKMQAKAEHILKSAQKSLLDMHFKEEHIKIEHSVKQQGVAKDICTLSDRRLMDAVLIARHRRVDLSAFFENTTSEKLIEYCKVSPVWIVGGSIDSKKVLVCLDDSEPAMRAVDHVGFMLAGTHCPITLFHSSKTLLHDTGLEHITTHHDLAKFKKTKAGHDRAPVIEKAQAMLKEAGMQDEHIAFKITHTIQKTVADDILHEAHTNGYGTIVLGRRGISKFKEFLFGSVTSQLLYHSARYAIWIVQ